jgi:hypothetical protein
MPVLLLGHLLSSWELCRIAYYHAIRDGEEEATGASERQRDTFEDLRGDKTIIVQWSSGHFLAYFDGGTIRFTVDKAAA